MGLGASRIDKFYATHEKTLERLEGELQRLRARRLARDARRAAVALWSTTLVSLAAVAAGVIVYKVQTAPPGALTYQQHLRLVGGALAAPALCFLLAWFASAALGWRDGADARRVRKLEDAKRAMVKDLKDMSRYERTQELILKYDPDTRPPPPPAMPMMMGRGGGGAPYGSPMAGMQQPGTPPPPGGWPGTPGRTGPGGLALPAAQLTGNVAGAAASAVAGAGRALVPLFDKLATTLISDNPALLEDLRRAQQQLCEADAKAQAAAAEGCALRAEVAALRARVVGLEADLGLPPSFDLAPPLAQQQQEFGGREAGGGGVGSSGGASGDEPREPAAAAAVQDDGDGDGDGGGDGGDGVQRATVRKQSARKA